MAHQKTPKILTISIWTGQDTERTGNSPKQTKATSKADQQILRRQPPLV
jgi:hypothetical protein